MEISSLISRFHSLGERADSSEAGARRNDKTQTRSRSGQDRVSLSPEAKQAASQIADAAARQRQLKVNQIKERVDNGTYEIDSENIAHKLIEQDPGFFMAGLDASKQADA